LGILFDPLLPFTSKRIRKLLNIPNQEKWDDASKLLLKVGLKINQPEILFAKIEDDIINAEIEKLKKAQLPEQEVETSIPEFKETIEFDDFSKLDLRVAKVIKAEKVPKTSRLLQLSVKLGKEERTIVSGIAEQYDPQELVGKNVVIIANLKPVKIRGVESRGMLLTSENDGKLSLLTVMQDIPSGSQVS